MLENEIIRIQASTRTTFPWLTRAHDFFRMRSNFYYRWHLNPRADLYHFFAVLIVVTVAVSSIFTFYSDSFIDQTKADSSSVTLDSQADWTTSGAVYDDGVALSDDIVLSYLRFQGGYKTNLPVERDHQCTVSMNGKVWVIGGSDGSGVMKNSVYSTTDGTSWTLETAVAGWSARDKFGCTVFDNKIWVIGGDTGAGSPSTKLNDVWWSTNGIAWTQATAAAGWATRQTPVVLVYDNKMWVLGGMGNTPSYPAYYNDVWWSTNGIAWTQATATAGWAARWFHSGLTYDNRMWIMGGGTPTRKNDVWYSSNGADWTQATAAANWSAKQGMGQVVWNGRMWLTAGYAGSSSGTNEVWHSSDGVAWTQRTSIGSWFSARYYVQSVVHNGFLWVLGGFPAQPNMTVWAANTVMGSHQSAPTQIDAGPNISGWTTFVPTATIPANTAVSFRFRTSPDGAAWTSWSASTPYASSIDISGQSSSNRYFQVETTLSNTDGVSAPTLGSYTVNFMTSTVTTTLDYLEVKLSSEADSEYDVARNVVLESSLAESTLTVDARGIDTLGAVMTGLVFTLTSDSCVKTADNQFTVPAAGDSCSITVTSDQGGSASLNISVASSVPEPAVVEPEPEGISFVYVLISAGADLIVKDETETFSAEAYNQSDQNITNQCAFAWEIAPSTLGTIIEQRNNAIDLVALKTGEYGDGIKVTAVCNDLSDDDTKDIAVIDTLVPNENWDWSFAPEFRDLTTSLDMAIRIRFGLWASFLESGKMYYYQDFTAKISLTNTEAGKIDERRIGNRYAYFIPEKEGCYPNLFKGEFVSDGRTYTAFAGLIIASLDPDSPNYQFQPSIGDFELRRQNVRTNEEIDYGMGNVANAFDGLNNRIPTASPYFIYSKSGNYYNYYQKSPYYRYNLNDKNLGYITPSVGVFRVSKGAEQKIYKDAISVKVSFNESSLNKKFDIQVVPDDKLLYVINKSPENITVAPGAIFNATLESDQRKYLDQWNDMRPGFYKTKALDSRFKQFQPFETFFMAPNDPGVYSAAIKIENTKIRGSGEENINIQVDPNAVASLCESYKDKPGPLPDGPKPLPEPPDIPLKIPIASDIINIIILIASAGFLASAPLIQGAIAPLKHLARGVIIPAFLGYTVPLPIIRGKEIAVVYDKDSKKPIPYATIHLLDNQSKSISKTISNEFGEFVLAKPYTIGRIEVKKRGYKPVVDPNGNPVADFKQNDGEHQKIYYSGQLIKSEKFRGDVFALSIPMKSVKRPAKSSQFTSIVRQIARAFNRYQIIILTVGSALSFALWWQSKSDTLSILILLGYLFLWFFEFYGLLTYQKIEGRVLSGGKEPIPGALIRIFNKKGRLIQSTKSDEAGRFTVGLTRKDYSLDAHKSGFESVREFSIPYYKLKNLINIKLSKSQ
jgi:hypothetical protein